MYSVFKFSEWKKSFCVQHKMILKENDLFFPCSLIDYIARKTKNYRSTVVNALGEKELFWLVMSSIRSLRLANSPLLGTVLVPTWEYYVLLTSGKGL